MSGHGIIVYSQCPSFSTFKLFKMYTSENSAGKQPRTKTTVILPDQLKPAMLLLFHEDGKELSPCELQYDLTVVLCNVIEALPSNAEISESCWALERFSKFLAQLQQARDGEEIHVHQRYFE